MLGDWMSGYRKFRCKLRLSVPGRAHSHSMYWERDGSFDIGKHLEEVRWGVLWGGFISERSPLCSTFVGTQESYVGGCDGSGVDTFVLSKMAQLIELPWDFSQPLWSSHVLHGAEHDTIIVRIHHTLGDGTLPHLITWELVALTRGLVGLSLMYAAATLGGASATTSLSPTLEKTKR